MNHPKTFLMILLSSVLVFPSVEGHAAAGETTRVSIDSSGTEGDKTSNYPAISEDGRYVAFQSYATNLVDNDTNGRWDIFVHDRQTGETTRVSVDTRGNQGNDSSYDPSISGDGRYITFSSDASNLVLGDDNGVLDIFIHDRTTGETRWVTQDADLESNSPSISGDGRYVVFTSEATNLVNGDSNNRMDTFLYSVETEGITRVSVGSDGTQGNGDSYEPSISWDGTYIGFTSSSTDLVASDTNGANTDVFVHNRLTGETKMESVSSTGIQGNLPSGSPSFSKDGRFISFTSSATNFASGDTNGEVDVFLRDTANGTTERISVDSTGEEGNGTSSSPSISYDGRYVTFNSSARNLVSGDTNTNWDVFVHDMATGETRRVNVDSTGTQAASGSTYNPSISGNGQYITFESYALNLVADDTNYVPDVFVHDLGTPSIATDIKANGQDGPVTITAGENLSITLSLYPGEDLDSPCDWWIPVSTPFGWYHFDMDTQNWLPELVASHQGELYTLPSYEPFTGTLPAGTYTFYFGVDKNMNGTLDMDMTTYDFVEVVIQNP